MSGARREHRGRRLRPRTCRRRRVRDGLRPAPCLRVAPRAPAGNDRAMKAAASLGWRRRARAVLGRVALVVASVAVTALAVEAVLRGRRSALARTRAAAIHDRHRGRSPCGGAELRGPEQSFPALVAQRLGVPFYNYCTAGADLVDELNILRTWLPPRHDGT